MMIHHTTTYVHHTKIAQELAFEFYFLFFLLKFPFGQEVTVSCSLPIVTATTNKTAVEANCVFLQASHASL
jgi:hypothetical protein